MWQRRNIIFTLIGWESQWQGVWQEWQCCDLSRQRELLTWQVGKLISKVIWVKHNQLHLRLNNLRFETTDCQKHLFIFRLFYWVLLNLLASYSLGWVLILGRSPNWHKLSICSHPLTPDSPWDTQGAYLSFNKFTLDRSLSILSQKFSVSGDSVNVIWCSEGVRECRWMITVSRFPRIF